MEILDEFYTKNSWIDLNHQLAFKERKWNIPYRPQLAQNSSRAYFTVQVIKADHRWMDITCLFRYSLMREYIMKEWNSIPGRCHYWDPQWGNYCTYTWKQPLRANRTGRPRVRLSKQLDVAEAKYRWIWLYCLKHTIRPSLSCSMQYTTRVINSPYTVPRVTAEISSTRLLLR
jgi:hypothetical protein